MSMANDERDRKFEKALANQLRSGAAGDSFARNMACPDAEILAAYHEQSLSHEELNNWKNHIAGCGRCQEVLAHLEITDELPVAAAGNELAEEILVSRVGAREPGAGRELTMAAAPAQIRAAGSPPPVAGTPVTAMRPRKTYWRWAAPAGAIAAGLLVWVALHEKSAGPPAKSPDVQIALNREPIATPAPAPQEATRAKNLPALTDEKKKESSARLQVPSKNMRPSGGFSNPPPRPSANQPPAPPPEPPVLTADAILENRSLAERGVMGRQVQKVAPAPPSPASNSTKSSRAYGGAALGRRATTATGAAMAAPAPAPAPAAAEKKQQAADETPAAASQAVTVVTVEAMPLSSEAQVSTSQNLRQIYAPDNQVVWMIGPSGFVQRSEDGGTTWKVQQSGVTADLRAGSARSSNICWLVGSAGVVLRTTDGGKNWEKVISPTGGDLGGVSAYDALHATVSDAANKASFVTVDGGRTWTAVAGE